MPGETSPVKAPESSKCMFWAPTFTAEPLTASLTAAREMNRAGVPQNVIMKLMGHKTDSMFRRYAIADAQVLQEGVEKLARHYASTNKTERTVIPIQEAAAGE